MNQIEVDIYQINKIYGDRVLVRRLGEPEKKKGIYVPTAYLAGRKEPKKVWFGLVMGFGHKSTGLSELKLKLGDRVAIEPLGNHYAGFRGRDGHDYVWVPDEHLCLVDEGSILDYYSDTLDSKAAPRLRILGDRLLLRPSQEMEGRVIRVAANKSSDAKMSEVIQLGEFNEDNNPMVEVGDKVLHVSEDSGTSAEVGIFDPPLSILRSVDLIMAMKREVMAHA